MNQPITTVDLSDKFKSESSTDIRAIYGLPTKEDYEWVTKLSFRMLVVVYHTQTGKGKKGVKQLVKNMDTYIAQHGHKYGVKDMKQRIAIFFAPVKLQDKEAFKDSIVRTLNGETIKTQWTPPAGVSIGKVGGSYVNRLRTGD